MRNLFLLLCALMTVLACKNPTDKHRMPENAPVITDVNQDFLEEFKAVAFDTLKVEAPAFEEQNGIEKRLSKDYLNLYPIGFVPLQAVDPPLYALSRFSINKNLEGLLIQGAGKDSKTSVNLMIYDRSVAKITSYLEIANHHEDRGYTDVKKTWLFRKDGNLSGLYWLNSTIAPLDKDDPTKPFVTDEYDRLTIVNGVIFPKKLAGKELAPYNKLLK